VKEGRKETEGREKEEGENGGIPSSRGKGKRTEKQERGRENREEVEKTGKGNGEEKGIATRQEGEKEDGDITPPPTMMSPTPHHDCHPPIHHGTTHPPLCHPPSTMSSTLHYVIDPPLCHPSPP
jgi:hypothetical protein